MAADPWKLQMQALGAFIRAQRQLAGLSLREMAEATKVSNAYLSQVERGLHQPSLRVLRAIAEAFNLSAEQLLAQVSGAAGATGAAPPAPEPAAAQGTEAGGTEAAILADPALDDAQRQALLGVYRSFVGGTA